MSQNEARSQPTNGQVKYVGPDTYILLDSAGRPQPMPGMTYEDFIKAWTQLNGQQDEEGKSSYNIEALAFTGRVRGQLAELGLKVTVRTHSSGEADVPLGLVGCILQGDVKFSQIERNQDAAVALEEAATAVDYLTYDPEKGGFVAHIEAARNERRTVSFGLIVPLLEDGPETTLALNCPRALSSSLETVIDSSVSDLRVSAGAVTSQTQQPDGTTSVKVAGPAGMFRLTWQSRKQDTPALASVLHAVGSVRVTIDGRGIRSDARLTVRSFGGGFDQLRVRLPAGAQLIPSRTESTARQDAKVRIRLEPDSDKTAEGSGRQIALVELPEKQSGPVTFELSTEHLAGVGSGAEQANLAGFEVIGAVRQFGDVALNVADDWHARWTIGPHVRQVDPTDIEPALQTPAPTAAFQYDRQPWSLTTIVNARQLRVHVTPRYELECLAEEVRLSMRLSYQVFGARAFAFRVDLNGWEITGDPVESGGLVDQDGIVVTPEGTLVLPLSQASSRRAEVQFTLRRSIPRDAPRLELMLPGPQGDSVGTGELVVRSAPDMELLPDVANSVGLVASASLSSEIPATGESPGRLFFRTLLPAATFVADRSARPGEVQTDVVTQVEIQGNDATVDQRIQYNVKYEPIGELALDIPAELLEDDDNLDLQLVTTSRQGDTGSEEVGTPLRLSGTENSPALSLLGTRHARVVLPQPRVGNFSVRLRHRLSLPQVGAKGVEWILPLLQPLDGELVRHRATVHGTRNLAVGLGTGADQSSWQESTPEGETDSRSPANSFTADIPESYLPLVIRNGQPEGGAGTVIDRVWLQSWFSRDLKQDRAAFRFRGATDQVTVELPPAADEFEVLVDGQPAKIVSRAQGRIVVKVPQPDGSSSRMGGNGPTTHTLELRYRQAQLRTLVGRHRLIPPQMEGSAALAEVYWQVVLPGDQHIVYSPPQLASASRWQWLGTFWGRRPVKSQPELEAWTGASEQLAPPAGHSEYLFTGLLPVATIELATMPRWLIVLIASGAVLVLAALWKYQLSAYRTWFLAGLALIIAIVVVLHPTLAALVSQAAAIGLVLSVLGAVLARVFRRPARPSMTPMASPSSQRMATPRTDSRLLRPVMSAASTAPTVSLQTVDPER